MLKLASEPKCLWSIQVRERCEPQDSHQHRQVLFGPQSKGLKEDQGQSFIHSIFNVTRLKSWPTFQLDTIKKI